VGKSLKKFFNSSEFDDLMDASGITKKNVEDLVKNGAKNALKNLCGSFGGDSSSSEPSSG
jgi:hypothetical protein